MLNQFFIKIRKYEFNRKKIFIELFCGLTSKKWRLFFSLKNRFKMLYSFYVKPSVHAWPILKEVNTPFSFYYLYDAFQTVTAWLNKRPFNLKYVNFVKTLRLKNVLFKNKAFNFYKHFKRLKNAITLRSSRSHLIFFKSIYLNSFFFKKLLFSRNFPLFLFLSFKNKRIFLNLKNKKKKTIFFLSQGFFLKFFEKKKNLKKGKNMKLLMAKLLRKLLFSVKIKNLICFVRNNPLHLTDFLLFLNTPIVHKYENPVSAQVVDETEASQNFTQITNFIFRKNIDFSTNKQKKKGRIKRKITRKVVMLNSLTD